MREALWESGAVGAALDSLLLANRFGLPEVRFAVSTRYSLAVLGASAHLSSRFGHPVCWPPDESAALWDAGRRAIHFC
jgi:hypothetical protein